MRVGLSVCSQTPEKQYKIGKTIFKRKLGTQQNQIQISDYHSIDVKKMIVE